MNKKRILIAVVSWIGRSSIAWVPNQVKRQNLPSLVGRHSNVHICEVRGRTKQLSKEGDDDYDNLENYYEVDESGDDFNPINDVWDLRSAVKNTLREFEPQQKKKKREEEASGTSSLNRDSFSRIHEVLQSSSPATSSDVLQSNKNLSNGFDDDESVFLDGESYLQLSEELSAEDNLEFEGSFKSIITENELASLAIPPDAPYTTEEWGSVGGDKELTLDDVMSLREKLKHRSQPTEAEEALIFAKVYEQERAFFEQTSELFRQGLTNVTAAKEAEALRRSASYRATLAKELNRLEKSIQEMESILGISSQDEEGGSNENLVKEEKDEVREDIVPPLEHKSTYEEETSSDAEGPRRVASYRVATDEGDDILEESIQEMESILDVSSQEEEGDSYEKDQSQKDVLAPREDKASTDDDVSSDEISSHPGWILVNDPSTGDSFYWNEETGEMDFEVPSED